MFNYKDSYDEREMGNIMPKRDSELWEQPEELEEGNTFVEGMYKSEDFENEKKEKEKVFKRPKSKYRKRGIAATIFVGFGIVAVTTFGILFSFATEPFARGDSGSIQVSAFTAESNSLQLEGSVSVELENSNSVSWTLSEVETALVYGDVIIPLDIGREITLKGNEKVTKTGSFLIDLKSGDLTESRRRLCEICYLKGTIPFQLKTSATAEYLGSLSEIELPSSTFLMDCASFS